jgi:hypothetical protein
MTGECRSISLEGKSMIQDYERLISQVELRHGIDRRKPRRPFLLISKPRPAPPPYSLLRAGIFTLLILGNFLALWLGIWGVQAIWSHIK